MQVDIQDHYPTFSDIEKGKCFTVQGYSLVMKTDEYFSPHYSTNAVCVETGQHLYFSGRHQVTPVDAKAVRV